MVRPAPRFQAFPCAPPARANAWLQSSAPRAAHPHRQAGLVRTDTARGLLVRRRDGTAARPHAGQLPAGACSPPPARSPAAARGCPAPAPQRRDSAPNARPPVCPAARGQGWRDVAGRTAKHRRVYGEGKPGRKKP